jgi:transcriptional regulator with XRE-family HTH domain
MILANRIRKIREVKNLTQDEVALRCNISASAYGQIERRAQNSTYLTLSKIADALGVSLLFLIDVDNPEVFEQKNKL